MLFLNKATEDNSELILTKNISKCVSPGGLYAFWRQNNDIILCQMEGIKSH